MSNGQPVPPISPEQRDPSPEKSELSTGNQNFWQNQTVRSQSKPKTWPERVRKKMKDQLDHKNQKRRARNPETLSLSLSLSLSIFLPGLFYFLSPSLPSLSTLQNQLAESVPFPYILKTSFWRIYFDLCFVEAGAKLANGPDLSVRFLSCATEPIIEQQLLFVIIIKINEQISDVDLVASGNHYRQNLLAWPFPYPIIACMWGSNKILDRLSPFCTPNKNLKINIK